MSKRKLCEFSGYQHASKAHHPQQTKFSKLACPYVLVPAFQKPLPGTIFKRTRTSHNRRARSFDSKTGHQTDHILNFMSPNVSYVNLKQFNECIRYLQFKLEMLPGVLDLMKLGVWMASIELCDAYHTIPVAQEHQVSYLKALLLKPLLHIQGMPTARKLVVNSDLMLLGSVYLVH